MTLEYDIKDAVEPVGDLGETALEDGLPNLDRGRSVEEKPIRVRTALMMLLSEVTAIEQNKRS